MAWLKYGVAQLWQEPSFTHLTFEIHGICGALCVWYSTPGHRFSGAQAVGRQLGAAAELGPRRALHFQPPGWPHPVTVVLPLPDAPNAAAEDALQGCRLELHRRLSAPRKP